MKAFFELKLSGSWGWLCIALVCSVFFAVTPSLQSPDETDHLKRAYWLLSGHFWLASPDGHSSGELVDKGLLQYMSIYRQISKSNQHVLTRDVLASAKTIKWQHESVFSPAPGTGYYLPLLYLPQGVGLWVGKTLDLTVHRSYQLARLFAVLSCLGLLALAMALFPLPAMAWAILFLPMNVFQWSAASLDGLSTALLLVILSTFMRLWQQGSLASCRVTYHRLVILMLTSLFVLVGARIQMAPLFLLPLLLAWRERNIAHGIYAIACALGVLLWFGSAASVTVDNRIAGSLGALGTLQAYVQHPEAFKSIIMNTFTSFDYLKFYIASFVGVLGYLDVWLNPITYWVLGLLLCFLLVLSVQFKSNWNVKEFFFKPDVVCLITISLSTMFLTFLALLLTWTPFPSTYLEGVQGRYFIMPALVMSYIFSQQPETQSSRLKAVIASCLLLLLSIGLYASLSALVTRYYMMP